MASTTSISPHVDLQRQPKRDKPSPLRVVKRHGSASVIAVTRASSSNTDESAPEPESCGDHLTIMKRRGDRYSTPEALAVSQDGPSGRTAMRDVSASDHPKCNSWDDFMFLGNGLAGSKTLNIPKTRASRPALEGARGHGAMHRSASLRSSAPGRTSASLAMGISPRNSQVDVIDEDSRSRISLTGIYPRILDAPARQPSPAPSLRNLSSSRTSCVLCPYISVTAECTALEADQKTV